MEKLLFYTRITPSMVPHHPTAWTSSRPPAKLPCTLLSISTVSQVILVLSREATINSPKQPSDPVHITITVSFKNAKSAFVFLSKMARVSGIKPREHQAAKDCISTMTNSVTSPSQLVPELEKMARTSGQYFEWHMSNVDTGVGSALTNKNICGRGLAGHSLNGRVKDSITKMIEYVSQVTSNALT